MHQALTVPARGTSLSMLGCVSVAGLLLVMAGGCQSYERSPLDIQGHHAAFLARTPDSPEVRSFAESLATRSSASSEFNVADGISCAEAEVIALVFNGELRMARLRAGVTSATAANAGLWEDPTINVDLTRIIQTTPDPWKAFANVGITLPISGRLDLEKKRAGTEHSAELARVAQREWAVRVAVRRVWSEWSALDAQLATTREFVTRIEQVVSIVDKMEQSGEMPRTEARLFRIERATRLAEQALLESRTREADLRLRALMGMSPDAPLRLLSAGIGPARSSSVETTDSDAARGVLERHSPGMLVAVADYEVAENTLELEIRKQSPDLHIGPGYGREDGQDQVLLGLSLPIPVLNANKQAIAEATARREVARAAAETTLEQLLSDFRAAEVRLQAATRRRQMLEADIVPLVDAQYADSREVARLGEVNTLILLESLTRQQEAKVSLVEARRDEALAAIDLDELLGPPLVSGNPLSPSQSEVGTPPVFPTTSPASGGSR